MNNLEFSKFLWNGVVQSRLYSIYIAYSFFFFFHFSIFSWSQLPFVFKRNPFLQAKLCIWVVSDISIKPRCDSQFLDSDVYIFYDSQVVLC